MLNKDYGTFHASSFQDRLQWNDNPPKAAISHILRVHDFQYLRKIQAKCAIIPNDSKIVSSLDSDTAISYHSYEAAVVAAGSVIEAINNVVDGKNKNAFCAIRPPGHHAGPSGLVVCQNNCTGSYGFCLLNNVAIGAAYARATLQHKGINKVAILDFDVHHGNGTEAIVRNVIPNFVMARTSTSMCDISLKVSSCKPWKDDQDGKNIFFASVHGYGEHFYPGFFLFLFA